MKITFEGEFEEIQDSLLGLFGKALKDSRMYADQAAASAAKSDTACRNSMMVLEEIKKEKVNDHT
jgi:hypothetical protein